MGGGSEFPRNAITGPGIVRKKGEYLQGIIDMGSNGIRFSVSDLEPPTARILPTLISYRVDISLYAAQYTKKKGKKKPISDKVIREVIAAFLRFRIICADLEVPDNSIRVIATEATWTAINSKEFCERIKQATGLTVETLAKESEGLVGALGVASGFSDVSGIVMDLGGGSCQITWMISRRGHVQISPVGSRSFPYGAAALTKKLDDLRKNKTDEEAELAVSKFREEMHHNFIQAYKELEFPDDMIARAKEENGFPLYLSGGGFRGWGYLLLYLSQKNHSHYPISRINGFTANKRQFEDTDMLKDIARHAKNIFRVSDRRRDQVPAVAFLVNALAASLPFGIKNAHFAQGGVREGLLFRELTPEIRGEDPLAVATQVYAKPSAALIAHTIRAAIPHASSERQMPASITPHIIRAFANVLYVHMPMTKETASTAALYSTSTGVMSNTHGVSHEDRALLAIMLERRYEGELPPRESEFRADLESILTPEMCWWAKYIGAVGLLVATMYPAGKIETVRAKISSEWATGLGKYDDEDGLRLIFTIRKTKDDPIMMRRTLEEHSKDIVSVGKRKHWIGGREGWGMAVGVRIDEVEGEL